MIPLAVEVRDFRKSYQDFTAVNNISFEVQRGEIFGLLGPNGAGKTSTLECLEGLRKPDSGVLRVMDVNPVQEPRRLHPLIGVQLQASAMPDSITPNEAMRMLCAYHHTAPRYDLLERMGLEDKLNTQYLGLSTGQKRRLALALAIAHNPPVVFLDEPTAGLDVISRAELHEVIHELQTGGTTIILSSHDMAEVEKLADRVAILLRGTVVASGSPRDLTSTGAGFTKISIHTEKGRLSELASIPAVAQKTSKDSYDIYYSSDPASTIAAILEYIKVEDDPLVDLRVERPSLEDRFLELTAHKEVAS